MMTRISQEHFLKKLRENLTEDDITFNLTKIHNKTGIPISTLSEKLKTMRVEGKIHIYMEIEVPTSEWIRVGNSALEKKVSLEVKNAGTISKRKKGG